MSKGYSFPKQPTLAELLGISTRTVQRHIAELVDFELLTVEVITTRKGRRNIYWIEDPSEEEFDAYLNLWNQTIQADQADEEAQEGDDKNVATPKRPKGAPPKGLRGEKSTGRIKNVKNKEEQSARLFLLRRPHQNLTGCKNLRQRPEKLP